MKLYDNSFQTPYSVSVGNFFEVRLQLIMLCSPNIIKLLLLTLLYSLMPNSLVCQFLLKVLAHHDRLMKARSSAWHLSLIHMWNEPDNFVTEATNIDLEKGTKIHWSNIWTFDYFIVLLICLCNWVGIISFSIDPADRKLRCNARCFLKKVLKNCLFWTYRKEVTQ